MRKPDILKLTGASLPTFNRWMQRHPKMKMADPHSLAGHPFPPPMSKEGRTLVWDEKTVLEWWAANKKLVGRHTEQRPTISISRERWGTLMFQLTRPYDEETENTAQARARHEALDLIRDTVITGDDVRLSFESIDDAIYFRLKFS